MKPFVDGNVTRRIACGHLGSRGPSMAIFQPD
jgi:hypothetical protein